MQNVMFCYPDWTQPSSLVTPTITGATWSDLDLLQGEILSEMARCPSVLLADTKFVIDLGRDRDAKVFAIPMHSAAPGDLARMRFATDAGFTDVVLDTDWQAFYGTVYPFGSLPWGSPSWWAGELTDEDAAGYVIPWLYVASQSVIGRYLEVSLDVTGNAAGYIDVGRVVCSPAIQPIYNVSYGVQFGWRDGSRKSRSKGGASFKDRAQKYRYARMQLEWLSTEEAYGGLWEMMRRHGTTEPFFFLYNADDDAAIRFKRSFMATATSLNPIEHKRKTKQSITIEIEEEK